MNKGEEHCLSSTNQQSWAVDGTCDANVSSCPLNPNENIYLWLKPSGISILFNATPYACAWLCVMLILNLLKITDQQWLVCLTACGVTLCYCVSFANWLNVIYVVTNLRILERKSSMFSIKWYHYPLQDMTHATYIPVRFIDSGHIYIDGNPTLIWKHLHDAKDIAQQITVLIKGSKH